MTEGGLGPPKTILPANPAVYNARGQLLVRFYNPLRGPALAGRHFGALSDMRFDHHPPPKGDHPDVSVWYASVSLRGALAETFGRTGLLDTEGTHRIATARVTGPLRLLDLVGAAARRVQLTQEIAATVDYALCQAWARAFHAQYRLHGIRWRGRQLGSICVVLDERAPRTSLTVVSDHRLTDAAVWPRIARAARDCQIRVV